MGKAESRCCSGLLFRSEKRTLIIARLQVRLEGETKMGVVLKRGDYWIDYRVNGRRYRKKVGPYKKMADDAWAKIRTEIAENKFLDVRKIKQVKFEDFADKYYELHCKVNHVNPEKASGIQVKILKRFFSGRFLHEINPALIERFKAERRKGVGPATVNRALTCLKAIFNKAIKWKDFSGTNPVNDVNFLKEENHKLRFLEKEEIIKLIECATDQCKPLITIAIFTGMRRGELLNLKWRDIDFNQGIIHLLVTKSGKKREIPMNDQVRQALLSIRKHKEYPYVFVNRNGDPWRDVRRGFTAALNAAGIKDFRFHDCRHTFASQLAMAGVDLNTIRELLGHSDLKTTLIYAHLSKDHKLRAVKLLGSKIETSSNPEPETDHQIIPETPEHAICN